MLFSRIPSVPVREAHEIAQDGGILVDVRERHEHAAGHAPGARLIPLGDVADEADEAAGLPQDRRILLICATGNRSKRAAKILQRRGHDVRNVAGGMAAWERAGLPVSR